MQVHNYNMHTEIIHVNIYFSFYFQTYMFIFHIYIYTVVFTYMVFQMDSVWVQ